MSSLELIAYREPGCSGGAGGEGGNAGGKGGGGGKRGEGGERGGRGATMKLTLPGVVPVAKAVVDVTSQIGGRPLGTRPAVAQRIGHL
eukprot:scaffold19238_cov63-Phaeocystis_antarctica.AAC.2